MIDFIWRALVIGAGGSAAMDVWALLLKWAVGLALPNWGMVGRWFAHVPKGTLFHRDIAEADRIANETAIGWIAHYATGIVYAGVLMLAAGPDWVARPTFLPASIVGMVTIAAGCLLLQPGMGAGWAASLKPNPWKIRMLNILGHTAFAIGLYVTARLLAA